MDELKIIAVDENNIGQEHICCAITDKKGETCVSSKRPGCRNVFRTGWCSESLMCAEKYLSNISLPRTHDLKNSYSRTFKFLLPISLRSAVLSH